MRTYFCSMPNVFCFQKKQYPTFKREISLTKTFLRTVSK